MGTHGIFAECYFIDGTWAVRQPWEYLEYYGDEPVLGDSLPPSTCEAVAERAAYIASLPPKPKQVDCGPDPMTAKLAWMFA
jgi:hypothetical protein